MANYEPVLQSDDPEMHGTPLQRGREVGQGLGARVRVVSGHEQELDLEADAHGPLYWAPLIQLLVLQRSPGHNIISLLLQSCHFATVMNVDI